jgi:spore germination protein KC
MKAARSFLVLLLSINMIFLSGCWNYRDLESLSIVAGIALDKGKEGYKYHATFELLDAAQDKANAKLLEAEGDTLFDCVRNAILKSKKKLFFSHSRVVVISNQLASEGVTPLLDFLIRDNEPRTNLDLIISKEKTAGEILQQEPVTDHLVSIEIAEQLQKNLNSLGEAPTVNLYQAINILSDNSSSLILPTIKVSHDKTKSTELDGCGIFKKDKLIGYLNPDETKYVLFINNKIKGGLLQTSPGNDNNFITVEISNNKTKVQMEVKDKDVSAQIEIQMAGSLGTNETSKDYTTLTGIEEAQKSAEREISYGVNQVIKKVQKEYGSDIFGFGSKIHQDHPRDWEKLKDNWEETFRKLKYTITTEVTLENTGALIGRVGA